MSTAILNEFSRLSTPEQVQLVEDLWDVIFAKDHGPALTDAQRTMLDRENAEIAHNPGDGITLAALKAQILGGRK